jgi:hypothetical protein
MKKNVMRSLLFAGILLGALALMLVYKQSGVVTASAAPPRASSVVALPGYDVSIFAKGTSAYYNPDSVEVAGQSVFVGYQNTTATDGSDHKSSTIVQYSKQGKVVRTISVPGHNDGLRYNPYTHQLWGTSDEDANPYIYTIDPMTGKITEYQVPPTPHKGGYDDLAFLNGNAFVAASNPTLNSAGVNVYPAVSKVTLQNGKAILTPILNGNATVTDVVTKQQVTLNLTDPDSMSIDNQGNLVLDSQADAEHIIIHNPGTAQQTVSRLSIGTQVDDTQWIPATQGRLLITDTATNSIYSVAGDGKAGLAAGNVYTAAPSNSGAAVAGFVGKLDPTTGTITPVIIGLSSPHGLAFLPDTNH